MIRIYFFLYLIYLAPYFSFAQDDIQMSIQTEDGIFTVSQTPQGRDMIICNIKIWNDMVTGTKYISDNLSISHDYRACIYITNKKQMHCKTGIGFRCGIFDCLCESKFPDTIVDAGNRTCRVIIKKNRGGTITIIFLNKVDWISLQNDNKLNNDHENKNANVYFSNNVIGN